MDIHFSVDLRLLPRKPLNGKMAMNTLWLSLRFPTLLILFSPVRMCWLIQLVELISLRRSTRKKNNFLVLIVKYIFVFHGYTLRPPDSSGGFSFWGKMNF